MGRSVSSSVSMLAAIAAIVAGLAACTTNYTPAALQQEEHREAAEMRADTERSQELDEEGGVNDEAIEEEAESVERLRDL